MKNHRQVVAAAIVALLLLLTPALAGARRIYFLVGVRHIYRIGPDRDLYLAQREEIEKTYADGIAADEATYQQHISGGANAADEAKARDADIELLAEDRDKALGALFDLRDDLRATHPELQVTGDGPYQVIGIDYHYQENVMVFDSFCVFAPWPGYVVVGEPYGGWVYGTVYTPGIFFNLYVGWHAHYGGPFFYGGFYGHGGPIPFNHGVFAGRVADFARPGGYAHAAMVRSGGFSRSANGGFRGAAGGSRPTGGYTHSSGSFHSGGSGGFSHSGSSNGRSGSFGSGSYSHSSSSGGSHGFGSYSRSATPGSSSGGSSHGGYSHGGSGSSSHSSSSHGGHSESHSHSDSGHGH